MKATIESKWFARLSPVVVAVAAIIIAVFWLQLPSTKAEVAEIVVYKTPTCGCCVNWIDHLRDSGLNVRAVDVPSTLPVHEEFGVPRRLGSCHTAIVGDYWVEGHVPADLVQKLMDEKPGDITGIAVPGMPMGSPGMEGPNPVEYQVVAYGKDGEFTLYATRQGQTASQ
jgi:hypothetical protein